MRDVALVPKRDVLKSGFRVAANNPREAADLLAGHGVALMRHGGAALLSRRERFFRFANFRSLQVADFKRDLFERGGNSGQRSDVMGVQIAREDLRGNRCGLQAKPCADLLLRLRSDVRKGPNSARYFAHTKLFRRFGETRAMALDLIPPDGEFQTEGNGLGVNSVRPP